MCVLQVLGKVKQNAKFQRHSSMRHAVMPTSVFAVGFLLCVPKTVIFLVFLRVKMSKILCSNPHKALPYVNMRLLVYCVSKSVQRPKL